jgi:hypothetical protein
MSLTFYNNTGGAYLVSGCIKISINPDYDDDDNVIKNKITGMLNGERGTKMRCLLSDSNGESEFYIDDDDNFILRGGEYGPAFGGIIKIYCSYVENKTEIDKFMMFIRDNKLFT